MENWLSIAAGVYLLSMVLYGHYRGFIRLAVSMVALVAALAIVHVSMPKVTEYLKENTSIQQTLSNSMKQAAGIGLPEETGDEEEKDDIRKVNEHEYTVDGTTKLEDIDKLLDLHLESEDYDSIAGHMIHELGHIPTEGEYIDINGIRFTVMKMDKHRVADIDIRLPEAETEQSPSEH